MGEGRLVAAPFLVKTYRLVDDPSTDSVISWGEQKDTFVVWRPKELSRYLLAHYFNHNNFSSFVRQLNTYGFRKIARGRYEFGNELFRKGQQQLLCHIQRRKLALTIPVTIMQQRQQLSSPSPSPSSSMLSDCSPLGLDNPTCPSASDSLVDQNENLRKKNWLLSSEIVRLRNICRGLLVFVNNHHSNSNPITIPDDLDHRQIRHEEERRNTNPPKLFGVPLRD